MTLPQGFVANTNRGQARGPRLPPEADVYVELEKLVGTEHEPVEIYLQVPVRDEVVDERLRKALETETCGWKRISRVVRRDRLTRKGLGLVEAEHTAVRWTIFSPQDRKPGELRVTNFRKAKVPVADPTDCPPDPAFLPDQDPDEQPGLP